MSEAGLFDEKLLNSALAEADAQHNRIVNRSTGSYDEDLGNSPDGIGYLNIAQPPKQLRAPVQGAGPMYPNPPPPQFQAQHGKEQDQCIQIHRPHNFKPSMENYRLSNPKTRATMRQLHQQD